MMFGLMKTRRRTVLHPESTAADLFQARVEMLKASAAKLAEEATAHETALKAAIAVLSEDMVKTQSLRDAVAKWS